MNPLRTTAIALFTFILSGGVWAQVFRPGTTTVFRHTILGFQYSYPSEMEDVTGASRAQMRKQAAALHVSDGFNVLLSISSGSDALASDWSLLSIETFPRERLRRLDDVSAEVETNALVAGTASLMQKPRPVVLGGETFVVSVYAAQSGVTRKGAVVWTTVRKDKLLSFAFFANSPEHLKRLTETMKTLQFF